MRPGGILLAEANQPPREVANYFGEGDECLAAYHFPLMPRMYKALVLAEGKAIKDALDPSFTPPIPENCQWFTFLRCHDELTLEMVTPEERKLLYGHYCRERQWDFRQGEGISARLADLLDKDPRKIALLNTILLTLVGTPVIFYGDEIAKTNDKSFYDEMAAKSGYPDSRYLNRGRIDWTQAERDLQKPESLASQVFYPLQRMMLNRRKYSAFSRGTLTFLDVGTDAVLAYKRSLGPQSITVLANLSGEEVSLENILNTQQEKDLLEQAVNYQDHKLVLAPYGFHWLAA
jgi:maltose alpha-D-glucosyltransferase / alpha-amylase